MAFKAENYQKRTGEPGVRLRRYDDAADEYHEIDVYASDCSDSVLLLLMDGREETLPVCVTLQQAEVDLLIEALYKVKSESCRHHLAEVKRSNRGQ